MDKSLLDVLAFLKTKPFVDLTHAFEPGIPHSEAHKDEIRELRASHEHDGYFSEYFCHVGQWGTHLDPPIHFVKGGRAVDEISLKEMLLPLVVFDVHEQVKRKQDYVLTMQDVHEWESRFGPVPRDSFAALRTDWSMRWPDVTAMQNRDDRGTMHYPGWSHEVLQFLIEERGITAIGHETTDTDPGLAVTKGDYSLEAHTLRQDRYQVELLTNLDKVPEFGSIIVVSVPKPKGGSRFPVRAFAISP